MKVKDLREHLLLLDSTDISDDAAVVIPVGDHRFMEIDTLEIEDVEQYVKHDRFEPGFGERDPTQKKPSKGTKFVKVLVVR